MGASGDPMRTILFGWQRRAVLLAAAMILSVIAACAGPRTVVDYNQGIDFSRYKTYQWAPLEALGVAGPEDPRISPLLRERIRASVDQVLLAKGYVQASPADFLVTLRTGLIDRQFVDHWGPRADPWWWRHSWRHRPFGPFAYDPFFDPFFGRPLVRTVTEGTIAIDMFDAETKQPIWHGHASSMVARDDISPADVQGMVDAVLADFPPRGAGEASR